MYSRVLVPLDASPTAATAMRLGKQLADRWGVQLDALALVEKGQPSEGISTITQRMLDRLGLHTNVDVRKVSYSAAEDIAGEFDKVDGTFVVMGSWPRVRSAGLAPNLAEEVQRLVRHPMLLAGPKAEAPSDWPKGPVHISIDGSDFSESIVESSLRFAKSLDLPVRFVTVLDAEDTPNWANPQTETNELVRLADQAQGILGQSANYDVLHGSHPEREIPDYARRYGASVIAMATHLRTGVSRITHGSVVMDVVGHAHCPILIDRPPLDEHS